MEPAVQPWTSELCVPTGQTGIPSQTFRSDEEMRRLPGPGVLSHTVGLVARAMTTPANAPIMLHTTSVVAGKREWLNSWDSSAASDRTAARPMPVETA